MFCPGFVLHEGVDEAAVSDESKVGAFRIDAGSDLEKGCAKVGMSSFLPLKHKGGAGAPNEPRRAESGGAKFFFDNGKNSFDLASGEGGIDPIVTNYDGFCASQRFF